MNLNKPHRMHWASVREMGCIITGQPATIHHCHGGSLRGMVTRGMAIRGNHWIVLPLALELHSFGEFAIDGSFGVDRWEKKFGTQLYWLCQLRKKLGYDFFANAGIAVPKDFTTPKFPEGL